jgi:hypothetical protein
MNDQDLYELFRHIEHGSLPGASLARQSNFRQTHICGFLNRKSALMFGVRDRQAHAKDGLNSNLVTAEKKLPFSSRATD